MDKTTNDENTHQDDQPEIVKKPIINNSKINSSLSSSFLLMFFGFMLAGFFGLYFIKQFNAQLLSLFNTTYLLLLIILGCLMMFYSAHTIRLLKKIGTYLEIIMPNQPISIADVMSAAKKNEQTIRKDFAVLFKRKYLYGYLDETNNEIVLTADKE